MAKTSSITIPTEPIGSIPRPVDLIEIRRCLKKGAHRVQGGIGNLAARHGAMSVQSPLTTTTAESHDVPFAACLALRCKQHFPAILSVPRPAGRLRPLSEEDPPLLPPPTRVN